MRVGTHPPRSPLRWGGAVALATIGWVVLAGALAPSAAPGPTPPATLRPLEMARATSAVSPSPSSAYGSLLGTIGVGTSPEAIAVDPTSDDLWVANAGSDNVSIISARSSEVVGTVAAGSSPCGIAFDPSSNEVYVANCGSDNLTVVDAATGRTVQDLQVGDEPMGLAVASDNVWVAEAGADLLAVVNSTGVVGHVPVGSFPDALGLASTNDRLFVGNRGSDNLSVVDPSTETQQRALGGVSSPTQMAFDPLDQEMYVTEGAAGDIATVNVSTDSLMETFSAGSDATGIVYDPLNGELLVVDEGSNSVSFLNTTSNAVVQTVSVGAGPGAVAYDPVNGELYVTDEGSDAVSVLGTSTASSTEYPLEFEESGLPAGTNWSVTLSGSPEQRRATTSTALLFTVGNGTWSFNVGAVSGYLANPSSGSPLVAGNAVEENITFSPTGPGSAPSSSSTLLGFPWAEGAAIAVVGTALLLLVVFVLATISSRRRGPRAEVESALPPVEETVRSAP